MKVEHVEGKSGYKTFEKVSADVYFGNKYFKGTEGSVERLLLNSKSAFQKHSSIKMFVVRDGNDCLARFALIHDHRLAENIQVAFFEAQNELGDLFSLIKQEIFHHFPQCKKVVVGLNGHLNYGAGILLNRFDEPPLFGLPYNPAYYAAYFKGLQSRKMFTFRFSMDVYTAWAHSYSSQRELKGLTVRFMDKKSIEKESAIYTELNNQAFVKHPYWANRDKAEDLELFKPFRFLLDNENLIIAEINGKPVGFFLWYPDFNQLVNSQRDLNAMDVFKYRLGKSIDTFRFTEIGILPEYQGSPVALALINKSLPTLIKKGYKYCEGGFIFEENRASIAFVKRILQRCYGKEPIAYREFATFETAI
ncbi:MAG: GNAT family N-acetyltransferase [Bacteroidales bacterium]|nr:GNAT family N-acetyltransferase [Bacteroidales bacterium]